MFNATQTYKTMLVKRLREEQDSVIQQNAVPSSYGEGVKVGYYKALDDVIRIIRDNDIPAE